MWFFLSVLVIVLGFDLGSLAIFFSDEIIEWLEAKADYYRARAASLRQENTLKEEITRKEGTE